MIADATRIAVGDKGDLVIDNPAITSLPGLRASLLVACVAICAFTGHATAEVRVGLVAPLSGPEAMYGQWLRQGGEDAVAAINRGGGVAGDKIVLRIYDDQCSPNRAEEIAKRMGSENVVAVVGHCPAVARNVRSIYESARIPLFMPNATLRDLGGQGSRFVFHVGAREDRLGEAAYGLMRQRNTGNRIAVMSDGSPSALELASQLRRGGTVVLELDLRQGLAAAEVDTRLKQAGADSVFLATSQPDRAVGQLRGTGLPVFAAGLPTASNESWERFWRGMGQDAYRVQVVAPRNLTPESSIGADTLQAWRRRPGAEKLNRAQPSSAYSATVASFEILKGALDRVARDSAQTLRQLDLLHAQLAQQLRQAPQPTVLGALRSGEIGEVQVPYVLHPAELAWTPAGSAPHVLAVTKSAPPPPPPPSPAPALPPIAKPAPTPAPVRAIEAEEPRPVWNILAERRDAERYRPVDVLQPKTQYTIRFDLAALAYAPGSKSVGGVVAGKGFRKILKELADTSKHKTVSMTAVVIPDPGVFQDAAIREVPFTVSLEPFRRFLNGELTLPKAPLDVLRTQPNPDFLFAPIEISISTRDTMARRPGAVAVSIWHDSAPVDEVSVAFCTAESKCSGVQTMQFGLSGIDSARTALTGKAALPAAAVHLLEFGKNQVVGVFRDNLAADPGYVVWTLDKSPDDLSAQLDNITASLAAASGDSLIIEGDALFKTLFPPTNKGAVAAAGRFREFFRRTMTPDGKLKGADPPALFVRAQFAGKTPPTLIPLGMAAISLEEQKKTWEFLGKHLRVESPLRLQSYGGAGPCIASWQIIGPPADEEAAFVAARNGLKARIRPGKLPREFYFSNGQSFPIIGEMKAFFDWVADGSVERPTVLSILSHHTRDHVRFASNVPVSAQNLARSFVAHPTVAILNGCTTGAAGAGATGFIRVLNDLGVQAVIATVTEVNGGMAGDFLDCFAQQVENAPATGRLLSEAFSGALTCLATQKGHGAKAYWYTLLGDGGLRLCAPRN